MHCSKAEQLFIDDLLITMQTFETFLLMVYFLFSTNVFLFGLCSFLQTSLHNLTVKGKHVGGGGNKDTCGHGGGEEGEGVEVRLERRGGRHL